MNIFIIGMIKSDYISIKHKDNDVVNELSNIISNFFNKEIDHYLTMETDEYREIVVSAQNFINENDYGHKIIKNIENEIYKIIGHDEILIQSNVYLRSARPSLNQSHENISWHRESFYGPNMENAFNVWTPIRGVSEKNTINYIPGSQFINSNDLLLESIEDEKTKQFSKGHQIGFLYRPKKIVGGIDFDKKKPMIVEKFHSSIFDAELIHGAGDNQSNEIRFSIDLRIIPKNFYKSDDNKKSHFASGKEYFIEL